MPNIAGKSKSLAAVHKMMSDLHRIGLVTHVASDHRFHLRLCDQLSTMARLCRSGSTSLIMYSRQIGYRSR